MTSAHTFPQLTKHADVRCFQCKARLPGQAPQPSGYPPRAGAWQQTCAGCGMTTYYDLQPARAPRYHVSYALSARDHGHCVSYTDQAQADTCAQELRAQGAHVQQWQS